MQDMVHKKKLKVGFDFDGVIAYNPFRVIRGPVTAFKRHVLGVKKITFFYPRSQLELFIWRILHDSSVFPSRGVDLLRQLVEGGAIDAHIISGRYNYLEDHLITWLNRYKLHKLFTTININKKDQQPHLFKEQAVKQHDLDYFIEDNLDIVQYLDGKTKTRIIWIYNLVDTLFTPYEHKFPYLEKAIRHIVKAKK